MIQDKSNTIADRTYSIIFDLLENNPQGLPWSELLKKIQEIDPSLHPKTINGYVWKLVEKYPDKVFKPSNQAKVSFV
ncbi:MAG: hypothetical protein KIH89_001650 [Candidatus Shapirobacteria bacterium]|nr:hypothetical protein [Candidatus Shapirobacteria bacterium]